VSERATQNLALVYFFFQQEMNLAVPLKEFVLGSKRIMNKEEKKKS